MKAVPFLTILTAIFAVAVFAWPGAQEFCVLDREATLSGEWWRAFTAHVVHFSRSHLWLNTVVFLGAASLVELQDRRVFTALFALASITITGAVLVFAPEFQFYGGLSGIATAMLFLLALQGAEEKGFMRVGGILVILAILAKLIFEGFDPQPLFARFDSPSIRSAPISHVAGIVAATAVWCATRLPQWTSRTKSFSRVPSV